MKKMVLFIVIFFYLLPTAFSHSIGGSVTYPLIGKDPSHMTGYRGSMWYQPTQFVWKKISVYFDASIAHWYITNNSYSNRSITIFAIAPVLRCYLKKSNTFSPYLEASIGPSYLSNVYFADRKLGMHFVFQDMIAVGALIGKEQRLSISLRTMHYSNSSLAKKNAGITIPLLITVGYQLI